MRAVHRERRRMPVADWLLLGLIPVPDWYMSMTCPGATRFR
jgi:hypothetical protein